MTRQLFALLALLSGLAALQAPAHAGGLDELSYDVQALSHAAGAPGASDCKCVFDEQKRVRIVCKVQVPGDRPLVLGVLPSSLVIGADRALE